MHTLVESEPFLSAPSVLSLVAMLAPSVLLAAGSLLLLERRDLRLR